MQALSTTCPDGGIGRRAGLKHQWIHFHAGSIPALGTRKEKTLIDNCSVGVFYFIRVIKKSHPDGWLFQFVSERLLLDLLIAVNSAVAQFLLNTEQLVVLGHTVGTAQ